MMKAKNRKAGTNALRLGALRRIPGAVKALCLSIPISVASLSGWSQSPIWTFGNAVINPVTTGTIGTNTSCAAKGAIPGFSDYLTYDGSNVIQQPSNTYFYGDPGYAAEVPFIIPGLCKQYYTIRDVNGYGSSVNTYLARWDYTDPLNNGIPKVSEQSLLPLHANIDGTASGGLVVGPLRADGSRFIYGITGLEHNPTGQNVVRYHISATGAVSPMADLGPAINSGEGYEGRIKLQLSTDGKFLFYGYWQSSSFIISRFDLSANARSKVATLSGVAISGLEWVPPSSGVSRPRLYYSWRSTTTSIGGLGYYDLGAVPAAGYSGHGTVVSNQWRYGFTDLERAADNSLYFASNPNPTWLANSVSGVGSLHRLIPATGAISNVSTGAAAVQVCRILNHYAYIIQDQIDGENYSNYSSNGFGLTTPSITLNGVAAPASLTVCNNNSPLLLVGTSSSYYESYQVQVEQGFLSGGTFIPTPIQCSTSIVASTTPSNTVDLMASFPNCVSNYNGYIRVTYTIRSTCGATASVSGLYQISSVTAAVNFSMVPANGSCNGNPQPINPNPAVPFLAQPTTDPPPCVTGWLGAQSVGITNATTSGSAQVTGYKIELDQQNNGTFVPLGNKTVAGPLPTYYGFNNILVNGQPNYFIFNYNQIKNNNLFRATVTVFTDAPGCTAVSKVTYFKIIDGGVPGGGFKLHPSGESAEPTDEGVISHLGQNATIYPNPASNQLTLRCTNSTGADAKVVLSVTDVFGRNTLFKTVAAIGVNEHTIDISRLAPGIYQYQIVSETFRSFGKFVKVAH